MSWFIGHMIGDFLLQNDRLANGKKQDTVICLLHVLIYTMAISVCLGIERLIYYPEHDRRWWTYSLCMLSIAIPHFLIDRTQFVVRFMKWNGQSGFLEHLKPWSAIVVDQVFHGVCLCGSAILLHYLEQL